MQEARPGSSDFGKAARSLAVQQRHPGPLQRTGAVAAPSCPTGGFGAGISERSGAADG